MDINQYLDLRKIKAISDYQFGPEITDVLFSKIDKIDLEYSKNTGKLKHVYYDDCLLLTFRPTNGFFTLSLLSAELIIRNIPAPKLRVIVPNDVSEFIKKGRNVFCKHVLRIDEELRPMDEIIVVNEDDELLAIGKVKIPLPYIKDFKTGIAIKVRRGIDKSKI